jgi:hypothetical protein
MPDSGGEDFNSAQDFLQSLAQLDDASLQGL